MPPRLESRSICCTSRGAVLHNLCPARLHAYRDAFKQRKCRVRLPSLVSSLVRECRLFRWRCMDTPETRFWAEFGEYAQGCRTESDPGVIATHGLRIEFPAPKTARCCLRMVQGKSSLATFVSDGSAPPLVVCRRYSAGGRTCQCSPGLKLLENRGDCDPPTSAARTGADRTHPRDAL